MKYIYQISTLTPYINWVYFFHAWKVKAESEEGEKLKADAEAMLKRFDRYYKVNAVVQLFYCNSDEDDIVLLHPEECPCPACKQNPVELKRLPMLRQQVPGADGYCLCLSDFLRPIKTGVRDMIGVFATSVDAGMQNMYDDTDPYNRMLAQTLADRLAEAGAECLHEQVRKNIWGYAPDENLTIDEMHKERFVGIRPAVGYPCMPDIRINFLIDELIDFKSIGVTLTESGMMNPHASVSGLMLRHPAARYFSVGEISTDQWNDYNKRIELVQRK